MAEKEIRLTVRDSSSSGGVAKLGNKKKIHKLPPHLRSKEDSDVYDPKVVSIGPFHHGKPQLQLFQGMKRKVLDHFISNSKQKDYEFYLKEMLEVVHTARSCYIMDDDEFDDEQFAEMMLLDACFLLNYFLMVADYGDDVATNKALKYYSPLDIITLVDAAAWGMFIERDTLLLDNQIPLWIIELLFNATYGNANANPLHTWKQLLSRRSQEVVWGEIVYENVDELEKHIMVQHHDGAPLHLLEFYHMLMVTSSEAAAAAAIGSTPPMSTKEFSDEYAYLFRSVMDLKSKGIHFSRNYTAGYSLRGIKFNSNLLRAEVKLPVINANAFTRVYFQSMIAYELCNYRRTQFVVGSYINFMKSLIVSPQDVKELREKCIIRSALGEDKEVVKLFHGLNTHGLENPIIFRDVKHKILNYYNSKTKTWMAEFAHTYFRTPWTAIAFFAATSLLVLTFLQTYFTINPRGH